MFVKAGLIVNESEFSDKEWPYYIPSELKYEWEKGGGIRPTEAGLEKIDYILPRLLKLNGQDI